MENFSKADELTKLAALRDQGLISQKDFEKQRKGVLDQPWSWRSKPSLIGMALAVAVTVVLTVALVVAGSHGSSKRDGALTFTDTAATTGDVQTAVNYVMAKVGQDYEYLYCLTFVNEAWTKAGHPLGHSYDPITYWSSDPNGWARHASTHVYNSPPKGALVFWGANPWSSEGHVALAVDNSGNVVSTGAYPYYNGQKDNPRVFEFNLSQRPATTYNYLGWIMPGGSVPSAPTPVASKPAPTAPTITGATPAPSGTGAAPGTGPVAGAPQTQGGGTTGTPSGGTTHSSGPASGNSSGGSAPTLTPAPTPAPTPPPTPTTYSETPGGVSHTWTNYSNAGGTEGPSIPSNETVQISCKVTGFRVADGDTWWYRIASSPWNNSYYVSADAFYNNGATSGSLSGTPFYDPNVPNC